MVLSLRGFSNKLGNHLYGNSAKIIGAPSLPYFGRSVQPLKACKSTTFKAIGPTATSLIQSALTQPAAQKLSNQKTEDKKFNINDLCLIGGAAAVTGLLIFDNKKCTPKEINPDFFKMVRRPSQQFVLEILNFLPNKQEKIKEVIQLLDANHIFDENQLLYVLAALQEGKISKEQLSTACFFWSASKQYPADKVSFGEFPQELENLEKCLHQMTNSLLSKEEMQLFIQKLKLLPKSEQRFLKVPYLKYDKGIMNQFRRIDWNVFDKYIEDNEVFRIIPSFGLMQTFIDVFAGENKLKINPVFGISTVKEIYQNCQNNERDMAIPFPLIHLPQEADTHEAMGFDFPYHDFYHAVTVASVSKENRKFFRDVSSIYKGVERKIKVENVRPEFRYPFAYLRNSFIDLEVGFARTFMYRKRQNINSLNEDIGILFDILDHLRRIVSYYQSKSLDAGKLNKILNFSVKGLSEYLLKHKFFDRPSFKETPFEDLQKLNVEEILSLVKPETGYFKNFDSIYYHLKDDSITTRFLAELKKQAQAQVKSKS